MIDTERSLERAAELHEAARTAKTRLAEREAALARLREQVSALKAALAPAPVAPPAIRAQPVPVRLPAPVARPAPAPSRQPASGWRPYAPYAAIAACALLIELGGARQPAPAAPDLTALAHPPPAVVANSRPAAKGAPVVTDDDRSEEALLMVHEWKLPGDEKSLGERLGGELDLPGGRPAWTVERTGAHGYRVTFQPAEKDLPYSFEADIESRVVWPTPDTQELLAPRFTAAFRDAVR